MVPQPEHLGHGDPQPGFGFFLLRGGLIDKQLRLAGQLAAKFFIRRGQRIADQALNFDGPSTGAGNPGQVPQESGGATSALAKGAQQQAANRRQSRSALAARNTRRKRCTGLRAAGTSQEQVKRCC